MKILAVGDFQGVFPKRLEKRLEKEDVDLIVGVGDYSGIKDWYPFIKDMFKRILKEQESLSAEEYFGKKRFKSIEKKDFESGKDVLRRLDRLAKLKKVPLLYVFGNTDDGWYRYPFMNKTLAEKKKVNFVKRMRQFININYKKRKVRGVNFIGFGGYMDIDEYVRDKAFSKRDKDYKKRVKKRMRKSKEKLFKIFDSMKNKKDRKNSILVTHYPPYGVFDIIRDRGNPMNGKSSGVRAFSEALKKYKPRLFICGHMHEYQGMKYLHGVPVVNPGDAGEGKYAVINLPENASKKVKVKFIRK